MKVTANKEKNNSIFLHCLNIMMVPRLIFLYYKDFSVSVSNKIVLYTIKLIYITFASFILLVLFNILYNRSSFISIILQYLYIIEYLFTVFVFLISKSTFDGFQRRIHDQDVKFNVSISVFSQIRPIIALFISTTFRIIIVFYYCSWFPNKCTLGEIFSIHPYLALDFLRLEILIAFETIRTRLNMLRKRIENTYVNRKIKYNYWIEDHNLLKNDNIKVFQDIYTSIADNVDMFKPTMDALVRNLLSSPNLRDMLIFLKLLV